jgi:hypothetical protein
MGGSIVHKAYELGGCKFTCKNSFLSNLFKLAKALANYLKQSRKISQEALFLKPKTNQNGY